MTPLRFFTDEDVHRAIAARLRAAGFEAISTPEANRLNERDPSQLIWAAQQKRVLMTHNVADFARLHYEWMSAGQHHAGIVVGQQLPVGVTLRRLLKLAKNFNAADMDDRLEYLSNWS